VNQLRSSPILVYEPAPCPRCGARTTTEAGLICRPERDETGEGTCPAMDCGEDERGQFLFPTAASQTALDDWYDEAADRDEAQQENAP
jgi:hypothetical protein